MKSKPATYRCTECEWKGTGGERVLKDVETKTDRVNMPVCPKCGAITYEYEWGKVNG